MKSSMGMATSVSYRDVPRDPSSSETRAIVLSSGASTTLKKSNWPSVAHCALTVAPSCSTSLLTSRMRAGLFLMVWTPSGVSVESMMYVGTAFLPGWLMDLRAVLSDPLGLVRCWLILMRVLPTILAAGAVLLAPQAATAATVEALGA